jgi:hypothetical protein
MDVGIRAPRHRILTFSLLWIGRLYHIVVQYAKIDNQQHDTYETFLFAGLSAVIGRCKNGFDIN